MALQTTWQTDFGPIATEAYARITSSTQNRVTLTYFVQVYWSKQAFEQGFSPISRGLQFDMPLDLSATAGDLIIAMYNDLNARDEFINAVKV